MVRKQFSGSQRSGRMSRVTDGTDERPRVLWLIKGLGPGGAENLLASSAEVVDQTHFTYAVAYLRADKDHLVARLAGHGVPARLLTRGALGRLTWPLRLRSLMVQADIVHAHSPLPAGVARLLAKSIRPSRRPVLVSTEHNEWSSFAASTRRLNALTSGLDHHRFAVSERVRRSMSPRVAQRTEVLVHGIVAPAGGQVGVVNASARLRSELQLDREAVLAITVANFRKEKDYPNLLRAARRAVDEVPQLHLAVVGQGPLRDEVHRLHGDLDLEGRVHLLGQRDDVRELLAGADLFVLGSAHEGLPVAIMEAMAAGLPIVATDVGGVADAVPTGVCGLVVPPRSPDALAEAIVTLARNPELRQRMSVSARERSADFDITTAVSRQEEVYAQLVVRGRGVQ
jgi:glycosyltransferase involved in cell wall biosynthesis